MTTNDDSDPVDDADEIHERATNEELQEWNTEHDEPHPVFEVPHRPEREPLSEAPLQTATDSNAKRPVNEQVAEESVADTTSFERIWRVVARIHDPQPARIIAERAHTNAIIARKHLQQLVDAGVVTKITILNADTALYKQSPEAPPEDAALSDTSVGVEAFRTMNRNPILEGLARHKFRQGWDVDPAEWFQQDPETEE